MADEAAVLARRWDRAARNGGRVAGEQRLVHEELDAVLDGRAPTLEATPALERTTMAIKEAMRLYPPAYALGRRSRPRTRSAATRSPRAQTSS